MAAQDPTAELLDVLEDHLVKEFRACSDLVELVKEERSVLMVSNVTGLSTLVERKEAVLDELGRLDDSRRSTMDVLGPLLGLREPRLTIAHLLDRIDPQVAARLTRLREGILTLLQGVCELTRGNTVLTHSALEHNQAIQAFIIDLCQPPQSYSSLGARLGGDAPLVIGYDQGI